MATTFDPLQKSATMTLSNGNLTATNSSAVDGARATRPFNALRSYFEATCSTITGSPAVGFAGQLWGNAADLGSQNLSLGYHPTTGSVTCNAISIGTAAVATAGQRIDFAHARDLFMVWIRVNGGNWNNDVNANPATGVGGFDYSTRIASPDSQYPGVTATAAGTVWNINFAAPVGAVPAGYSLLDTLPSQGISSKPKHIFAALTSSVAFVMKVLTNKALNVMSLGSQFVGITNTYVQGTIKEEGVLVGGRKVEVFDRASGELLAVGFSAADGTWKLPVKGRGAVRVVASDPSLYNSQTYDNVIPG